MGSRCSSSPHLNPSEAVSAPSHPPWSESAAVQARSLRSDSSHTADDRLRVNPNSLSYPFPLVLRVHVRVSAVPILILIEG